MLLVRIIENNKIYAYILGKDRLRKYQLCPAGLDTSQVLEIGKNSPPTYLQ